MKEIHVHAASAEEAQSDGAAALGLAESQVSVEILDSDEHGVTARVYEVPGAPVTAPTPAAKAASEGPGGAADSAGESAGLASDGDEDPPADAGDAIAERALEHLRVILDCLAVEANITVDERDGELLLEVEGDQLGPMIGNAGQTLNAIQLLLNIMVKTRGSRTHILVDAGGYRHRRREKLEAVAFAQAQRAKDERRDVILEGLPAAERSVIHTALQSDPDVVTFSEGEEPHRRLIISPRKT